jgi:subtilisin-like proprotein convertase family protein/PKD repeat protein/endonuclease/exonuclease/phosphatase family metal-dependent hydrolase
MRCKCDLSGRISPPIVWIFKADFVFLVVSPACRYGMGQLPCFVKSCIIGLLVFLVASVTALAQPIADFVADRTTACTGQTVVFTSTSTGTVTSYNWDFGAGASPATSTSSGPVSVSYGSTGYKSVRLIVSGSSGTDTAFFTDYILVRTVPAVPGPITGSESVCAGAAGIAYSVVAVPDATTYAWTLPAGATIASGSGSNAITADFGTAGGNVCVSAGNACGTGTSGCKSVTVGKERIKLMTYNLLNYPDLGSFSTDTALRNPFYRTVIGAAQPDILVTQENQSQAGVTGFLNNVMNKAIGGFSAGVFFDGPDTDNALFFKNSKFSFVSNTRIPTELRDINEFKLVHILSGDTLRIYSVHLKASATTADEAQRAREVDSLRAKTNLLPPGSNFIVCGDFNFYYSGEPAYVKLLQTVSGNEGHFIDPITMSGTWNNGTYAQYHTQSPRTRAFGGGTTGGLDDRFDLVLYSTAISQSGGITFVPGSTTAFGNDGNHYNDSINMPPNTAVAQNVADALHYGADHLPVTVLLDFENTSCPFADAGAVGVASPDANTCANGTQSVGVRVRNYGSSTLNFGFNNLTIGVRILRPGGQTQTISGIVSSGSLNANTEQVFYLTSTGNFSDTGSYQVRAYTSLPGDTVLTNDTSATGSVKVYPNATATVSASGPTTFCAGGGVTLQTDTTNISSFRWQLNGSDITGAISASYTAVQSGSYRAVVQRTNFFTTNYPAAGYSNTNTYSIPSNSCTGASSPVTVSGYAGTVASAGISVTVNITHPYVGDLVLFLEAPNGQRLGLSNRTGNNSNAGDNYTNTVFSDAGSTTIPVTGAPYTGTYKPWSSTFSSCVSSTITSFASLGSGSIDPDGIWRLVVYDRANSNTGSIQNWTLNLPAYSVTSQLICDPVFSQPVTVTAVPVPVISISPAAGAICSGGSVTLTASGANSYSWSPSSGLSNSTGASVLATPTSATTYTVTGSDAFGCTGSNTVTVTISQPPVVTLSAFQPVCLNSSPVTLTGGSPAGGTWAGPGVSNGIFSPSAAGVGIKTISYTYTDANGCSVTATQNLEVRALPAASTSPSGSVILCTGNSLIVSSSAANTYSWSTGSTASSITVTAAGSYFVTVTGANGCSNTSPALTVTTSSFTMTGTVFTETMGTVSATTSIATHETNNGFDNDGLTMSGTADVRITTASSGYTGASGTGNIFFTNTSGRLFTIAGINTSGLSNLQLSFGIYKSTSASTGSDFLVQVSTDGSNFSNLAFSALPGTGTGWFLRTVTTGIPSSTNLYLRFLQNSTTTQYRIDDLQLTYSITTPFITATGPTSVCRGSSVSLTASTSSAYLWDNGATTQTITATSSGDRFCTVTGSNGCRATTAPLTVTVSPELFQTTGGGSFCNNGSPGVSVGLDGSQTGVTYTALLNGTPLPATAKSGTGSALSMGTFTQAGTYAISALHTATGCSALMSGQATVAAVTPTRWFEDADNDGYGDPGTVLLDCTPPAGYVIDSSDCNDNISSIHPGATEICGNGTDDDCDGLTDENCSSTLVLRLLIEGIYSGNGRMTAVADPLNDTLHSDTVTVQLAVATSPYTRVHTFKVLLARDGSATTSIPSGFVGSSYYLVIRHRNSLETWSSVPVAVTSGTVNYDFTDAGSKAFGNNLKSSGDGYFSLYSGDVNQDNVIDFTDLSDFEIVSTQHQTGYVPCDIDGDRMVESADGSLIENNASGARQSIRP